MRTLLVPIRLSTSHVWKRNMAEAWRNSSKNSAWKIYDYKGKEALELHNSETLPVIENPHDVLVRVKASSLNPLDLWMSEGNTVIHP